MGSSHKLIAIIKWETCESVEHESTQVVYLWDCLVLLSHDSNMSVTAWIYVDVTRQHKKKARARDFMSALIYTMDRTRIPEMYRI